MAKGNGIIILTLTRYCLFPRDLGTLVLEQTRGSVIKEGMSATVCFSKGYIFVGKVPGYREVVKPFESGARLNETQLKHVVSI